MNFPGKPETPKPEAKPLRTFDITLTDHRREHDHTERIRETIQASYFRWEDGLVTFWESKDGPHDFLVIGYPLTRIRAVEER